MFKNQTANIMSINIKPFYKKYSLKKMSYYVRFPENFNENKKYPLLIFLHGSGERGSNLELVRKHGPLFEADRGRDIQFIIVAPQCLCNLTWFDYGERLSALTQNMTACPYVDSERVFVSGLSMGGYGAWSLAMSRPDVFAAVIPVCGGGMAWNTFMLKDVAVRAYHGDADETVNVQETCAMVERLKSFGAKDVTAIIYSGCGHNAWTKAYADDYLYTWLAKKKKITD